MRASVVNIEISELLKIGQSVTIPNRGCAKHSTIGGLYRGYLIMRLIYIFNKIAAASWQKVNFRPLGGISNQFIDLEVLEDFFGQAAT